MPVCRAMMSSSFVGMTHADTRLPVARSAARVRFASSSSRCRATPMRRRSASDLRGVLADAGGEDQPVDAAEHRRQRADLLGGLVHEVVHRESRAGSLLSSRSRMSLLMPEMPSSPTSCRARFEILRREPERLDEMQDHAGVDRSRSGPHAEAVERGEAERAVPCS
jgi:hypothetical protein